MRGSVVLALVVLGGGGCTDSHKVTITFAGDGVGWVEVSTALAGQVPTGTMRCTSSCTIDDASSVVHLLAGTPSTFGGWSSVCDNSEPGRLGENDCELRSTTTSS